MVTARHRGYASLVEAELARKVCRLVAGIVITDDDLAPEEEAFIDKVIARFGLSEEDRDALFPIVEANEAVAAIQEFPENVQKETLSLLISAAVADGQVVGEERVYLAAVSRALGVSASELTQRIQAELGEGG
jgi:uncharacterized tellurite resistance protein B-like protein